MKHQIAFAEIHAVTAVHDGAVGNRKIFFVYAFRNEDIFLSALAPCRKRFADAPIRLRKRSVAAFCRRLRNKNRIADDAVYPVAIFINKIKA